MASRIAIVGAGPHGLSIAAHLNARGLQPMVFGRTMEFWRNCMPEGVKLKSDGFASDLSEPTGEFTLKNFCEARRLPYGPIGFPIPRETFVAYGEAFQRRFVPQVDQRYVTGLARGGDGFELTLDDGARVEAAQVVVATGIAAYANIPMPLAKVSTERMSHSSALSDCSAFARKRVLVVGSGASATDCAAALADAGAEVSLVCRDRAIKWVIGGHGERSWRQEIMAPTTPVGPGWKRWVVTRFPHLFRRLPEWARVYVVDNMLGPAPAWFIREELEGRIRILPGREILGARESGWGVDVEMGRVGSQIEYFRADHVVLGTGYRIDLRKLAMLAPELRDEIGRVQGAPRLQANFMSTVPGLYFAGAMSAYTFGPMMRFVCGAGFTARRISAAIEQRVGAMDGQQNRTPAMVGLARS
jgi:thioredoxin reductase